MDADCREGKMGTFEPAEVAIEGSHNERVLACTHAHAQKSQRNHHQKCECTFSSPHACAHRRSRAGGLGDVLVPLPEGRW